MSRPVEVPLKVEIVRNGVVEEIRRRRLVNPSFEVVEKVVRELVRGAYRIEYYDEDSDAVTMDTEEEWQECLTLWKESGTLRIRVKLIASSSESPQPVEGCRWARSRTPPRNWEEWRRGKHQRGCWGKPDQNKTPGAATEPQGPNDLMSKVARYWLSAMNTPSTDVPVGKPCKSCNTFKTTGVVPVHCCMKCAWSGGAAHGPRCQQQKISEDKKENESEEKEGDVELVRKVFDKLFGSGDEVLTRILMGETTEKDLGCERWLKIEKQPSGDVDLDVDTNALSGVLSEYGLRAMHENNKEDAVGFFTLCTSVNTSRNYQRATAWYNLACCMLMQHPTSPSSKTPQQEQEVEEALAALEKAVELGYKSFRHMYCDSDLETIRSHPRFLSLFPRHRAGYFGPGHGRPGRCCGARNNQAVPSEEKSADQEPAADKQEVSVETPQQQPAPEQNIVQEEAPEEREQQVDNKYAKQLQVLKDMGLDSLGVVALLEQHEGNLEKVLEDVLQ